MSARSRNETPPPRATSSQGDKDASSVVAENSKTGEVQPVTSKSPSKLLWDVGFFVNIILIYYLGRSSLAFQESQAHLQRSKSSSRAELYGVVLLAACPRCALISTATCEDTGVWWHGHTDLASAASAAGHRGEWHGKWWYFPSGLISFDPSSGVGAWDSKPLLTTVLFLSVWGVLVQDAIYLLIICKKIWNDQRFEALGYASVAAFRNVTFWMYAWVFYLLCPWLPFPAADQHFLVLTLGSIFLFRIISIVLGGISLFQTRDSDLAHISIIGSALSGCALIGVVVGGWGTITFVPFLPALNILGFHGLLIFVGYPVFIYGIAGRTPMAVLCANILVIEQLADWGFANVLLLETLRHKTSLWNYISIRLYGGCTSHGGKATGSTASGEVKDDTRGKFYVFKDTFWGLSSDCNEQLILKASDSLDMGIDVFSVLAMVQPNIHAFLSARSSFSSLFFGVPFQEIQGKHLLYRGTLHVLANIWGLLIVLAPSLKFRSTLDDMVQQQFKNDTMYGGMAWFTSQDVPASWIGPWGTLCGSIRLCRQGCMREITRMPSRALRKFVTGVLQLLLVVIWLSNVSIKESPLALMLLPWL